MSYTRQVDATDTGRERENEMVEIPTRDYGPVNPYTSAYESSAPASGFVAEPTMVQMPAEYYESHQPQMVAPLMPPETIDPTASCCGRYSLLLWGSKLRQLSSAFLTVLMIIGVLLITFAPRQCTSGCSELPCAGDDGNTYDCTCETECRAKSEYSGGGRTGVVFCILGVAYFAACAIWAAFQRTDRHQHVPLPIIPQEAR